MPKFKIDGMDAARAETLRFALQKASSLLFKHPDLILETLAEVEAKVAKAAASNHVIDEPMFSVDKVTTFRLVPGEWIASWLQAQSGGLLTDSLLQKVLGKSHGQFERLKMFATQLPGCMAWTGGLMYKKVAARALDDRARQLGNPVSREWVEKAIAVTGDINWAHGCRSWGSLCFCSFGLKQLFLVRIPLVSGTCIGCLLSFLFVFIVPSLSQITSIRLLQVRVRGAEGDEYYSPLGGEGGHPAALLHR